MWTRVRAQLRHHPRRLFSVALAIVIGVGFTAACVVFSSTVSASQAATIGAQASRADLVVDGGPLSPGEVLQVVSGRPGLQVAEPQYSGGVGFSGPAAKGSAAVDVVPDTAALRWFTLDSGTWPGPDQLLVDDGTATRNSLAVGTSVRIDAGDGAARATVSGIVGRGTDLGGGTDRFYLSPALMRQLGLTGSGSVAVLVAPGADVAAVQATLADALPDGTEVVTGQQRAQEQVRALTDRVDVLQLVLIGFAVIALTVAAIVIANTFTILLAGRRREVALLRCIGASARQARREILLEGAILGAAGSLAGLGLGVGVAAAAGRITGLDAGGLRIPIGWMAAVFVVGVLVTVLAAGLPAHRATTIAPLAALRPVADTDPEGLVAQRVRSVTGLLLVVVGGAALTYGATGGGFMVAMAGGVLSAVGVLLLTRVVLPQVLRLLAPLARIAGVPGAMAARNARRHPARSAGTSAALLVGVALIVTLQVGAASATATLDAELDGRYPVDVVVTDDRADPLPDSVTRAALRAGLDPSPVIGAAVTSSPQVPGGRSTGDGTVVVIAPSDRALAGVHGPRPQLDDRTVIVPSWWTGNGVVEGSTLTLRSGSRSVALTVVAGHLADVGAVDTVVVSPAALRALDPAAAVIGFWSSLPVDADAGEVTAGLQRATADLPTVRVAGSVEQRGSTQDALGTIVTVATALLAVAVLIAVLGIGNTLGLSVLERARETALMRALGVQRGQLRSMVALEALLLAAVGAVVGVVLGGLYGVAGAMAAVGETERGAVIDIPWAQVGLVVCLALVAGLAASVLPARRAAAIAPAAALAQAG